MWGESGKVWQNRGSASSYQLQSPDSETDGTTTLSENLAPPSKFVGGRGRVLKRKKSIKKSAIIIFVSDSLLIFPKYFPL